ncbi:type IX secretion system protein PorQ [Hymenobacter sp. DG25A]|uniref:type IX secretion system protein PorQ n=1 Tax=Hymenobacter sp. DG25A TaxID=1385663 RepID=UPI0006BC249C|nr:type IX secretion system protein PorQ [Hymenobacter sp. DG25A]ALD20281.1 hypothetical protein AM218_02335 [Hymenobacter sp. DG25A]
MKQGHRIGILLLGLALAGLPGSSAWAQIGGQHAFEFLSLPASAKLAGLGGVNVSARDADGTMLLGNPALLNEEMDGRASLTYIDYLADIRQSTATYVFNSSRLGRMGVGLTYLNYGRFEQFDAAGNSLGEFSVNEYALGITKAVTTGNFTLGGTAKLAVSGIAGNHSVGTVLDAGGLFKHPTTDFTVALAVKNLGYQLRPYAGSEREPLPLDVQVGATIKPEHMPMRFSLTAHHLQQFDIVYLDSAQRGKLDENNEEIKPKKSVGDKIARHFVVGGELLLSKNFQVRVGYNHLRRRELRLDTRSGGAGLSFGVTFRLSQFQLDYTRAYYHVSGASNYFTLARSLDSIFKKNSGS